MCAGCYAVKHGMQEGPQKFWRDTGSGFFEGEIRDVSYKQEWEAGFQIQAGGRLHVFEGLGCRNREV